MAQIETLIASEINASPNQVEVAVTLIDEGATVPFIARYRKERTGGLDDDQLRKIEERLTYLRELEQRRASIIKTIEGQGKLEASLLAKLNAVMTRSELEDLYLPFKPKRRTKAQIAIEAGLEPLAQNLVSSPNVDPFKLAEDYVSAEKGVETVEAVLEGASDIVIEGLTEKADLLGSLRGTMREAGRVKTKLKKGKEEEGAKFADYFSFEQDFKDIPPHRALALLRAEREGVISLGLDIEAEGEGLHPCERKISSEFQFNGGSQTRNDWLKDTVHKTWKGKLHKKISGDLIQDLREKAETEAIRVFSQNLKDLMLAAPAGPRATIGLDPGYRTGVKVAVVDKTGKLVDHTTIYPNEPRNDIEGSLATLAALVKKHNVEIVSIGNGTASRETDRLAAELIKRCTGHKLIKIVVSEAGASVYSASALASKEFPDLDVSIRGAVSIARRLQDPLAELVKIEAKAIGVGQYQHDVDQAALQRSLDAAVEDCVNSVGVDLNMASAELLSHISGLNQALAANIVDYRNENGAFKSRSELKKVARLGPKAFEQAAGFLRIRGGKNPLDQSAVHPEAYSVVKKIAEATGKAIEQLIGDSPFLKSLDAKRFADEQFGVPTINDILSELDKPGRDPRPTFEVAQFADGVEKITDLKEGMQLEGVVTNVTNFGAFVDIGVHQDGLVHISQMADKFVSDPREIVKAGAIVKVRVTEVDVARKRIGLSMKSPDGMDATRKAERDIVSNRGTGQQNYSSKNSANKKKSSDEIDSSNPFAAAFAKASKTKH